MKKRSKINKKDTKRGKFMKKYILRVIFLIIIILISSIIFGFSAQDGEESGGLSKKVVLIVADIFNIENDNIEKFIEIGEPIVRKLAHFGIYTILGIASMAFMVTFNISKVKQIITTILWGIVYASTDEFHQTFIDGRNGSILDVLLDTSGVIFGIAIVLFTIYLYSRYKNNKKEKTNEVKS